MDRAEAIALRNEVEQEYDAPVVLFTERTARADYPCAGCTGTIRKGQRYRRVSWPPETRGDRWASQRHHLDGGCTWDD